MATGNTWQFGAEVRNLAEVQAENNRAIADLQPSGALGQLIKDVTLDLHRYDVSIVHVDTGGLIQAQRMRVEGAYGEIFIDPYAVNRKGQRPIVYGPFEHGRGGEHAFMDRTVTEYWPSVARRRGAEFLAKVVK
jgi:hypothetical protein